MKKKLFALFLSLALCLAAIPFATVSAADDGEAMPTPVLKFDSTGLSEYTTDGASVVQWQSTGSLTADANDAKSYGSTAPTLKTNGLNGYPTVVWGESTTALKAHGAMLEGPNAKMTVVAVYKTTAIDRAEQYVFRTDGTMGMGMGVNIGGKTGKYCAVRASEWANITAGTASTDFQIVVYTYDLGSGDMQLFLNGGTAVKGTGNPSTTAETKNIFIGATANNGTNRLVGEIAEFHVYQTVLTDYQVDTIGYGLAAKFDLNWTRLTEGSLPHETPLADATLVFNDSGLAAYENGADVTRWESTGTQTADQYDAIASGTAPKVKVNGLNGHKTVAFDGNMRLKAHGSVVQNANLVTVVAVVKTNDTASEQFVFRSQGNFLMGMSITSGGYNANNVRGASASTWFNLAKGTTDTNFHILVYTWDKNTGEVRFFLDGGTAATGTTKASPTSDDSQNAIFIGGQDASGKRLNGEIAEFRVYEAILNDYHVDIVGTELASKYGLNWTRVTGYDLPGEGGNSGNGGNQGGNSGDSNQGSPDTGDVVPLVTVSVATIAVIIGLSISKQKNA